MLPVYLDPYDDANAISRISEKCCICRHPTLYWYKSPVGLQETVAVCQFCADVADPSDVPSRAEWFRREKVVKESLIKRYPRAVDGS